MFENVFGSLFQTERLKRITFTDEFGDAHTHDQLLRYIRRCVTGLDHPFALPDLPCYLNEFLACEDFVAGMEPKIGRKHIRVIAIDGFPRMSSRAFCANLDALPIEYRWNTRAILIDPEDARSMLDMHRKKWRSKIRGWKDQILRTPVRGGQPSRAGDGSGRRGGDGSSGCRRCPVLPILREHRLPGRRRDRLYENTRKVMKTVQNLGFRVAWRQ